MDMSDKTEITGPMHDRFEEIRSPTALEFLGLLHRELNGRRGELGHPMAMAQTIEVFDASIRGASPPGSPHEGD